MKKFYCIIICLIVTHQSRAQIVNIPDAKFKSALLNFTCADLNGDGEFDSVVDTNNDKEIQISEVEAVLGLDVGIFNINTLEGIASFKNLEVLYCDYNNLTSLDVSKNLKLEFLECTINQLTILDVSKNLNLQDLYCPANSLTSLDVSKNLNLEILRCAYNQITSLDLSKNSKLTTLMSFSNKLTSLNLKNENNTLIKTMMVKDNLDLTCIEVDDIEFSKNNEGWIKETGAIYSENCGLLGTDPVVSKKEIVCYPNPVSNILNIEIPNIANVNSISVYDALGKRVLVEKMYFEQLDLSLLNKGLYTVIVEVDGAVFTKKIVKE